MEASIAFIWKKLIFEFETVYDPDIFFNLVSVESLWFDSVVVFHVKQAKGTECYPLFDQRK